jgi:hypothetical protein
VLKANVLRAGCCRYSVILPAAIHIHASCMPRITLDQIDLHAHGVYTSGSRPHLQRKLSVAGTNRSGARILHEIYKSFRPAHTPVYLTYAQYGRPLVAILASRPVPTRQSQKLPRDTSLNLVFKRDQQDPKLESTNLPRTWGQKLLKENRMSHTRTVEAIKLHE